ncbi:hypothetical protein PSTEL_23470 [Paenibacillus stellifer]|uniref:Uncharacterized protein n=1 Tax=Paenibacillus stellifer TaxID=169760 RepID=A0A089LVR4_9BACL|nr:hypothetical protein [Paenibacillus stellifer]AIQ65626.1 hypothetical protein PSTEL_23470 [Paenibacillus stellifer]
MSCSQAAHCDAASAYKHPAFQSGITEFTATRHSQHFMLARQSLHAFTALAEAGTLAFRLIPGARFS